MSSIPKTAFGRTTRLLLSGARIATQEIAGRVAGNFVDAPKVHSLATKVKQTQELVQTLSQLKGAAMKAGQMLSLEYSDLLPPEVVEILRQLHDASSFMSFPEVQSILRAELGPERTAELVGLTPTPIAAASIGQVHRATLNGRSVVVKIQFPGVGASIDADLAVLRRAVALYLQVQGKHIELSTMFDEFGRILKQETDYRQEAAHAERYRSLLSGDRYVVPEVFNSHSTAKVLTLSYESGARLADWLKAAPGPKAVAHLAELVIELLIQEFFVVGLVQTDPNYGNFLYRPVDGRLVLLDFGATNPYPIGFRNDIRTLLDAAARHDEAAIMAQTFASNLLDPRETPATQAMYRELIHMIGSMFDPAVQPFRFAGTEFLAAVREAALRFVQSVEHSTPARQVIFLNRKLGGMFHLLKDAGAELDMRAYLERVKLLDLSAEN